MVFTFSNIKGLYFSSPEISSDVIQQKLQELEKHYISNGLSSIDSAIVQYQCSTNKHLFGVFYVSEVDEAKEWICLNVTKKHDDRSIFSIKDAVSAVVRTFKDGDASTYKIVENTLKYLFNEKLYDLIMKQHSGTLNTVINNALESFCTVPQPFDQIVVAQVCEVRVKDQLNRFLSSLESLLASTPKYTLDRQKFTHFCKMINSLNFGPAENDVIDLRAKILALIVQLKENGQIIDKSIDKDVFKHENGFLVKETSIFLKEIKDYDEKLKEDPRNMTILKCLQFAINDRIDYLSNKNKLVPDLVKADEVLEIFEHFVLDEEIESFKNEEDRLEKDCVAKFKEIGEATEDRLIQTSIEDNMKLQETHHKLEYLSVKLSIRNDCNFKDLISVFASKSFDNLNLPLNFLTKIFEIKFSESLVTDIIKIVLNLPKTVKIQTLPDDFCQYLTPEQLLELTERLSVFSSTFIDHLVTILVENDHEMLRGRALDALIDLNQELSDETKTIIELETKIHSDTYKNEDLLTHVTKNYRLTWNSFQTLLTQIGDEELTIIKTIIDNDLQILPKFLVDAIKKEINSNLVQSKIWLIQKLKDQFKNSDVIGLNLKMCEMMIVGNYMRMNEVSDCLVNHLKDEKHQEVILNIILTATQSGEIISESIVEELEMIQPKTALVHNCIKAVTKKETLFDVLKNSKNSIKDRKLALIQLVNDQTCHNDYLVQILSDLVIFEPKLRDDAFEAFLTVITSETWNRVSEMVEALKVPGSRVSIKAISDACKKDFLQHNEALIDYLLYRLTGDDFRVKTDCVSTLTNMLKSSQNKVWVQTLLDIAYSERDTKLRQSILTLITEGFVLESLDQSIQMKVHTLKTLLCDKIDETFLSSLVVMINDGLVVSEFVVQGIIRCLSNEEYSTVASECLWMVHSRHGLKTQSLQSVFSIIEGQPTIINNQFLLKLLQHGMDSNQQLSLRVLQRLLELISDDDLNLLALNILDECMKPNQHNSKLNQLKQELIQALQRHCLEMLDIEFIRHALKTLLKIDVTISTNDAFIRDFYEQLKPFLSFSNDASQANLDIFISTTSNKDRIQLLHALTITVTDDYHLNPEMFVKTSENEWLKDLLIDVLIQSVIIETGEMDELALYDFLTELKVVEVRLSQHDQRFKQVLECLVDSNLNNFESLLELLFLVEDKDALQVFVSKSKDIGHKIHKMKEILLKKRLPNFSSQQIQKLLKPISHLPARTIDKLIDIECDSPETLITFFERVQSNLDPERRESFLNKISNIRSFELWNIELSKMIIERLVAENQVTLNDEMNSFKQKLSRVLDSGWSLHSIGMILDRCKGLKDAQSILSALDVIYEYKLKEYDSDVTGKSLIEIISTTPTSSWGKIFHKVAIFQTFPGTYQKPVQQLFDEISNLNSGHEIGYLKDRHRIQQDYEAVKKTYLSESLILSESSSIISKFDKSLIKKWAQQCKDHQPFLYESIAVAMRAVEILNKFLPRDIQILSLLCLLNPKANKGRLAQINTGEGKTTIIAMLAVIKALQGHTIDIITSSGELAKPQSIEMEPFYSMFGLTVAHNGEDPKDIKERYKANILYGAADAFQGDILRDEYSKQGTRNGRKCDLAIVDEVDSMLIDGKNHIVMLSSFMPAMNYLETVLAAIYIQIRTVADLIVEKDGKAYLIERKNRIDNDGLPIEGVKDDEIEITVSKKEFIERSTELHIRKVLRDVEGLKAFTEDEQQIPEDYTELSIPKHLYELVTGTQLKKWIDSAIYAMFKCELNKHYVLTEDGKVAPVDATNTGVIQQNMHWNNGLHQFLQIKHGAKITPENLTTNFISNVSFFKRYKENLFGLTGTLGSDDSIKLLNKTYSVDSLIIPPFKQKQHHELTPIIVTNEEDWYKNIIESTLQKLHQGQGVLIIARYINQVNIIHDRLKSKYDPKKIKVYKTQRESDSVHAELKAGEVIIATNIAGRGTDIKPSPKIDENGGLHVCLTFLPDNARVEAQNVGRTSRTGNKGTSQFILLEKSIQTLNQLRHIRNEKETESLTKAETEIARVCTKDAVFHQFCNFLNKFEKDENKPVEERFGIWLQTYGEKLGSEEDALKLFKDTFEDEVMQDSNQIRNICFHILKANKFIKSKEFDEAIVECNKAIAMDPRFADAAYYFRGYCRIAKYGGDSIWKRLDKVMVRHARDDFVKARKIINQRLMELNIIQQASKAPSLSEQVKHKTTIYQVQLGTIQQAVGLDRDEYEEELSNLRKNKEKVINETNDKGDTEKRNKNLTGIQNRIKQIEDDLKKDKGGVIGKALSNSCDIRITMIELEQALPPDQDLQYYKQEIDEFKGNGMIGHFNISELKPIPWKEVFIMASIAFVQMAVGAYIMVSSLGAGSQIGKTLILEGINDLITAVKDGIINRNIDWEMWGKMKCISLAASLCLCGVSSIKDASKSVQAVGKGIKTIGENIGNVKEGVKIALKNVGFELSKGVAREVITTLAEHGLEQSLLQQIENYLVTELQPDITEALEKNTEVQQLLEMDLKNHDRHFQNLIRQAAHNILHPQDQKKKLGVQELATMFATRIANAKVKNLAMATQLFTAGVAIKELVTLKQEFLLKLNESIHEIMNDVQKANSERKENKSGNDAVVQDDTSYRNLYISPENEEDEDDIKLNKASDKQEHAVVKEGISDPKEVCRTLSESVAKKMTNIIKSKIVMPVTHAAVNFTIEKVTSGIQQRLDHELQTYKSNRVIKADNDRLPDEIKDRAKDPKKMEKSRDEAKGMIKQLEDGSEAGLIEARALSEAVNRKIIIYDKNGKLYEVINNHLPDEPLELQHHPGQDGNKAHWTMPGGVNPPNPSGENNCMFDCVAHQLSGTNFNPDHLRSLTVEHMIQNIDRIAVVMPEITHVKMYGMEYLKYGGHIVDYDKITKDEMVDAINKCKRKHFENVNEIAVKSVVTLTNGDDKPVKQILLAEFGPDAKAPPGTVSKSTEAKEDLSDKGHQKGNHIGHIVGKALGGSNAQWNLTTMPAEFNGSGGAYWDMESDIRKDMNQNQVWYSSKFIVQYDPPNGPNFIKVEHRISQEKGGPTIGRRVEKLYPFTNVRETTSWKVGNDGNMIDESISTERFQGPTPKKK